MQCTVSGLPWVGVVKLPSAFGEFQGPMIEKQKLGRFPIAQGSDVPVKGLRVDAPAVISGSTTETTCWGRRSVI